MGEVPAHVLARLQKEAAADWNQRFGQPKLVQKPTTGLKAPQRAASRRPAGSTARWLAMAACTLLLGVLAAKFLVPDQGTRPVFAWTNDADLEQQYDLWVLPPDGPHEEVKPLFTKKAVRSPVTMEGTTLEKEKPYRLLVCLANAGKFAGEPIPFTPQQIVRGKAPTAPEMLQKLIREQRLPQAQQLLNALPDAVRNRPEVLELAKLVPP
jgi:hypothetical protein